MNNEIDNPTHNEMVFRNFIRSHQLTAKWHEFIKENPLEDKSNTSSAKEVKFAKWIRNNCVKYKSCDEWHYRTEKEGHIRKTTEELFEMYESENKDN
jgi:hypothetical protein